MAFGRGFLSLAALLPGLAASAAQTLDIAGPYGNFHGCVHLGGSVPAAEGMFVLNTDGLQVYDGACEFVQVLPAASGASVVTALCQGEGMYNIRMLTVSEPDPENESLLVFFADGELWHEVKPCS